MRTLLAERVAAGEGMYFGDVNVGTCSPSAMLAGLSTLHLDRTHACLHLLLCFPPRLSCCLWYRIELPPELCYPSANLRRRHNSTATRPAFGPPTTDKTTSVPAL